MRRGIIYQLDVPHREPVMIRGFVFGDEHGARSCAIVGSLRGNEVQQAFICASLVSQLAKCERSGLMAPGKGVLVIPCANPFSMNIQHRFWPTDSTDINRSFPGDEAGETTERIAAALIRVARTYTLGIQLCSFYQAGDFLPHVRVTRQGAISQECLVDAAEFALPYVLEHEPTSYDKATLNYVWQEYGTRAFSVYSRATDRIDTRSAHAVSDAVLRFLARQDILHMEQDLVREQESTMLRESELVDVRTHRSAGFLVTSVQVGAHVSKGQELAQVLDAFDTHVLEVLSAPCDGRVFFMRTDSLVQQHMVVLRIAPR